MESDASTTTGNDVVGDVLRRLDGEDGILEAGKDVTTLSSHFDKYHSAMMFLVQCFWIHVGFVDALGGNRAKIPICSWHLNPLNPMPRMVSLDLRSSKANVNGHDVPFLHGRRW